MRISVNISLPDSAFSNKSTKKASAPMEREPPGPKAIISAF